jgi:hypothetical protein
MVEYCSETGRLFIYDSDVAIIIIITLIVKYLYRQRCSRNTTNWLRGRESNNSEFQSLDSPSLRQAECGTTVENDGRLIKREVKRVTFNEEVREWTYDTRMRVKDSFKKRIVWFKRCDDGVFRPVNISGSSRFQQQVTPNSSNSPESSTLTTTTTTSTSTTSTTIEEQQHSEVSESVPLPNPLYWEIPHENQQILKADNDAGDVKFELKLVRCLPINEVGFRSASMLKITEVWRPKGIHLGGKRYKATHYVP